MRDHNRREDELIIAGVSSVTYIYIKVIESCVSWVRGVWNSMLSFLKLHVLGHSSIFYQDRYPKFHG